MINDSGEVQVIRKDEVSYITFSHPQHNSMPSSQLERLAESILAEGATSKTKVILLQSGGDRTFCAGANFQELLKIRSISEGKEFFSGFARVILAMRDCEKIIIGRVQGKAVGGGVGLLAATDYCMATKWASLRLSELSIGIGPYVIEPAIKRKIGTAGFSRMALNPSTWQDAVWAQNEGLYQDIFESIEDLDIYLTEYLNKLTSYNSEALRQMKLLLWERTEDWQVLLHKRAEKSANLLLTDSCQKLIKSMINS